MIRQLLDEYVARQKSVNEKRWWIGSKSGCAKAPTRVISVPASFR